jgi:hypothetical protein
MTAAATTTTARGWNVLDRAGAVLWREYRFAGPGSAATTLVFRGEGDALIVVSPASKLEPDALDELSEFGVVKALVANNAYHWLGQPLWKKHFPDARCFAPADAIKRLTRKGGGLVFERLEALAPLAGSRASVTSPPGLKMGGSAFVSVRAESGTYFHAADLLFNVPSLPPQRFLRLFMSMTDSAPGYKLFRPAVWLQVKDKNTLRGWFDEEFKRAPPTTVVPAHGVPFTASDLVEQTKALLAKM